MRILVVGSCGKKKLKESTTNLTCEDLASIDEVLSYLQNPGVNATKVREMYTGYQSRELVTGVDLLRQIEEIEVTFCIISAGFGFVHESDMLPPYDCSFSGMKKSQIQARAGLLNIPSKFEELLSARFDLVYLALGKEYFQALGEQWRTTGSTIIGFNKRLTGNKMLSIPSGPRIVSSFSKIGYKIHGVTGFKGDLLRILANYALVRENPYNEVLGWMHPIYLRDLIMKLGNLESFD